MDDALSDFFASGLFCLFMLLLTLDEGLAEVRKSIWEWWVCLFSPFCWLYSCFLCCFFTSTVSLSFCHLVFNCFTCFSVDKKKSMFFSEGNNEHFGVLTRLAADVLGPDLASGNSGIARSQKTQDKWPNLTSTLPH